MLRPTQRLLGSIWGTKRPRRRPQNYQVPGIYPQLYSERSREERVGSSERFGKPMPVDRNETHVSKKLSYILRHNAKREGVSMRKDGFVRVDDLLSIPKLHSVDFLMLEKVVRNDTKSRYKMIQEDSANGPVWWIRANQGHSIPDIEVEMQEVTDPSQIIMAVHGTTHGAWNKIREQGLSRKKRQHIHFAQGVPKSGVISGMRATSQILIYLDVALALTHGVRLLISANDVVLSPGDSDGYIHPAFFERVEHGGNHQAIRDWTRPSLPPSLHAQSLNTTEIIESEETPAEKPDA